MAGDFWDSGGQNPIHIKPGGVNVTLHYASPETRKMYGATLDRAARDLRDPKFLADMDALAPTVRGKAPVHIFVARPKDIGVDNPYSAEEWAKYGGCDAPPIMPPKMQALLEEGTNNVLKKLDPLLPQDMTPAERKEVTNRVASSVYGAFMRGTHYVNLIGAHNELGMIFLDDTVPEGRKVFADISGIPPEHVKGSLESGGPLHELIHAASDPLHKIPEYFKNPPLSNFLYKTGKEIRADVGGLRLGRAQGLPDESQDLNAARAIGALQKPHNVFSLSEDNANCTRGFTGDRIHYYITALGIDPKAQNFLSQRFNPATLKGYVALPMVPATCADILLGATWEQNQRQAVLDGGARHLITGKRLTADEMAYFQQEDFPGTEDILADPAYYAKWGEDIRNKDPAAAYAAYKYVKETDALAPFKAYMEPRHAAAMDAMMTEYFESMKTHTHGLENSPYAEQMRKYLGGVNFKSLAQALVGPTAPYLDMERPPSNQEGQHRAMPSPTPTLPTVH